MAGRAKREAPDVTSRRSIEFVGPPPAATNNECVIRYFYHLGTFWKARIPLDGLEHVFGQSFNFSRRKTRRGPNGREIVCNAAGHPVPRFRFLNHVQSRFRLLSGYSVDLYELNAEPTGTPKHHIDDFVYSVEATGPPGFPFSFYNGISGVLTCAHRFLSTKEMVFERVVVENQYVWESAPLPLNATQKRAVLEKSLGRSDVAGMNEAYRLVGCFGTNNCTSNPFQIVDSVCTYRFPRSLCAWVYRLPLSPRFYLRIRGLDANPSESRLVRTEFEEFISLPDTQARKRTYVREAIRKRRAEQGARGKGREHQGRQET